MISWAGLRTWENHSIHADNSFDCSTVITISTGECQALVDLYSSTNGIHWTHAEWWLISPDPCTWTGVNCLNNHVSSLDLHGNNLSWDLPPSLGNLSQLQKLSVDWNNITSFPPEIGNLSRLQQLYVNNNQLSSLPPEMGNLFALQDLYLDCNLLTSLPPEIGNLSVLQILNLEVNHISSLPPEIGNLTRLQELHVNNNQLTSLPPEIGNLTTLQLLTISNNNISSLPSSIGNLTGLYQFVAGGNQLTSIPPEIGNLTRLQELDLEVNHISSLPSEIGNLSALQIFYINNNQITSLPPTIGNLSSLQEFYLNGNQITSLPSEIGNLSSLQMFQIESNQLSSLPSEIGNLSGLQYLYAGNNHLASLPSSIGDLTRLQGLNAGENQISSLPDWMAGLTGLQLLDVNNNQLTSLPNWINNLSALQFLNLDTNHLTVLPASLIQLFQSTSGLINNFMRGNNTGLQGIALQHIFTWTTLSGSLLVSGNQYIGYSGASWDGIFLPPQFTTWSKIAVLGETGLDRQPLFTVEVWSKTADLIPYTGTFTLSVKVASWTSGQQLNIFRSEYNDGDTWTGNTPDAWCTLDGGNYCIFQTDHLSLFTFVDPLAITPSSPSPSWGGGWVSYLTKDQCPELRDCSDSYYDHVCGKCPLLQTVLQKLPFHMAADKPSPSIQWSPFSSELNDAYLWAYAYNITSLPTIQEANLKGTVTRKDMAKMVSNFLVNVVHKDISTWIICNFTDIQNLPKESQYYIMVACRFGLMWYESNGVTIKQYFDPTTIIDRSQFGTILSRLLRGAKNNGGTPYYLNHLSALQKEGIMTKVTAPRQDELRWRAMLMMMRAAK